MTKEDKCYWYWLGERQKRFIDLNGSLGEPVADDFDQYPYIPQKKRDSFIKRTRFPIEIKNHRYVSMRLPS